MRNLNRIRSNGSEQLEARELLSGHSFGGGQAGSFGGSKGGFGGSKGSGSFSGGSSSTSTESSSSSGSSYSSSSYDESSYASSSYSGGSYSGGGYSGGGCHRWGYSSGYSAGYSIGYQTGFIDGVSYATSGNSSTTDSEAPTDQCQPPELPEECPTPAPEPTPPAPPAPPTPGPSEDFSHGYFNGNEYQLLKQNGTKYTYKNYNLQGGHRTIDYNTITGTFKMHSPIAFDLNGTGKIETTGVSTAQHRTGSDPVGSTVSFDINGDGAKENIEWMSGSGDGLLVDNRDGNAATSMNGNRLFGTAGGFANGYDKLASLDKNRDGKLTGAETKGLQVWVDNGNAQVDAGELKSLGEFKINQISVRSHSVINSRKETLMQSTAGQGSNQVMSEDVWFAQA